MRELRISGITVWSVEVATDPETTILYNSGTYNLFTTRCLNKHIKHLYFETPCKESNTNFSCLHAASIHHHRNILFVENKQTLHVHTTNFGVYFYIIQGDQFTWPCCKKWPVQCTLLYTCALDTSLFTRFQKKTAMFIWSPCIL